MRVPGQKLFVPANKRQSRHGPLLQPQKVGNIESARVNHHAYHGGKRTDLLRDMDCIF
jgi:hypothetical protein